MMLNKLSLNTIGLNRIGLNRIGKPSRGSSGRPYIDPEVLASLKAVCICYGKSNDDPDRAIVKNLVDPDNPFIISNAAYKLNSGYGLYGMDFLEWKSNSGMSFTSTKLTSTKPNLSGGWLTFRNVSGLIPETKVKVSGAPREFGFIANNNGTDDKFSVTINNGVYTIPEFTLSSASGFYINNNSGDWSNLVIEQIPSYQGAFVTDGVEDLITSTKTVQEMGINDEITVVSMIHQIGQGFSTNNIRNATALTGRSENLTIGKTGIYGWSKSDIHTATISNINNILGDKNDYSAAGGGYDNSMIFSVEGYKGNNSVLEVSSVAWYWTVIANKVLTTDQINQVIAYYNLDRCVEPTVLYDVKRQGLSNDTPDSDWYLKDFSKNGFDMSLFNFAKKGNSGVGKYETDFLDSSIWKYKTNSSVTSDKIVCNKAATHIMLLYYSITDGNKYDVPSFNVLKQGDASEYYYIDEQGTRRTFKLLDGINTLPASHGTLFTGTEATCGFGNPGIGNSVTITQIPSHAGALCSDGVNDFGKVTGLPIYKDYTVVADYVRTFAKENVRDAPILSKSQVAGDGAFLFNYLNVNSVISSYSFGTNNVLTNVSDSERKIYYQSKYVNGGKSINSGTGTDYDSMWLGTYRDDSQIFFTGAIYSLMTFPYSMSEFLIERQLKKHKLGTLYPDMVEFRPIYTSNVNDYTITKATYFDETGQHDLALGNHYPIGTMFRIYVKPSGAVDEVTSIKVNGVELTYDYIDSNYGYAFNGTLSSKSPQKIDITIDEYIRYEDIVQPYPAIIALQQDGKNITWGDKLKVGDEVTFVTHTNLLPNLYTVSGAMYYNGKFMYGNTPITVAKSMTFTTVHNYIKSNEPKCILSPSRLRIPNSSYKILGYIPDISGHGNHGKINNSAYAGMSGANGYVENFTTWGVYNGIILTDNAIKTNSYFNPANSWVAYKGANTILNSFSVNITGIPEGGILKFRVNADTFIELSNGRNDLSFDNIQITVSSGFRITNGSNLDWSNLVIQQIGEYEGAYCLDGVDDFITIPTTVGGKQVLMKVNWQSSIGQGMLYDQRGTAFAIWNSDKFEENETDTIPAYSARNGGNTYIDGILNKNILASQLRNITHNIVATNTMLNGSSVSPTIGCNGTHNAFFTNMSFYDFMLFDEISTDEEILTLNEYIGIEPKSKEGLLQPSITVNGSYVVLDTVEDTNDYLVNGTANCGIGFSDESASEQFSTGVTYDKNFSYSIIVIANNNKELISLSHNGVSADSIQSMDYSETTKLYICSTTNGMFAVGSAPQEIIIELSD